MVVRLLLLGRRLGRPGRRGLGRRGAAGRRGGARDLLLQLVALQVAREGKVVALLEVLLDGLLRGFDE
jgi:hypothetical protein